MFENLHIVYSIVPDLTDAHVLSLYTSQLKEKNMYTHKIYVTGDVNDLQNKCNNSKSKLLKKKQFDKLVVCDYTNNISLHKKLFYLCSAFEPDFNIYFYSASLLPIMKI